MTALSDPNVLVPEIGTYRFEPSKSSIAFVTKHMFGLGKVKGSFDLADGELVVVEPATNSTVAARATASSSSRPESPGPALAGCLPAC